MGVITKIKRFESYHTLRLDERFVFPKSTIILIPVIGNYATLSMMTRSNSEIEVN